MSGALDMTVGGGGALYTGVLTSGTNGTLTGFSQGAFGSINPTKDVRGNTISGLTDSAVTTVLSIDAVLAATYFSKLISNGVTLLRSAASFTAGNPSTWTWSSSPIGYATTGNYSLVLVP